MRRRNNNGNMNRAQTQEMANRALEEEEDRLYGTGRCEACMLIIFILAVLIW